jgi:RNA polymerase sigma factor (sigma-70 family)
MKMEAQQVEFFFDKRLDKLKQEDRLELGEYAQRIFYKAVDKRSDDEERIIKMYIEKLFDLPGIEWMEDEVSMVLQWLLENPQKEKMLRCALRHLGSGATYAKAEDALQGFFLSWGSVFNTYRPAEKDAIRFFDYALFCLKRFCWREGDKIRKQDSIETKPDHVRDDSSWVMEIGSYDPQTEKELGDKEVLEILRQEMNEMDVKILCLFYLEGWTDAEIGRQIGIQENTAKVRRIRVRSKAKKILEAKGVLR